ncbi:MAG TPA: M56 family metallopeptidase [Verrucomicrobiae bacterium]|jgi:beta-lactamase regulating signal transducer with metallopeptidase domain/protocatechuate 3,4-dioxygenase beta subunit
MNASPFFDWLARTSWQASVLVLLVLGAQRLFRGRLNARWQYALWLLVVARLAMPSLPASSWSVFNVLHYSPAQKEILPNKVELTKPVAENFGNDPVQDSEIVPEKTTSGRSETPAATVAAAPHTMFDKRRLTIDAEIAWLIGVVLLGGRGIGQSIVFVRRLRGARAVTDAEMLALFDECKEIMGVSAPLRLEETDQVSSPALYGFFRPSLLLPRRIIRQFTPDEQRHIFLHELAHVKRRDMAVHWVAAVFRLLHWFNPVLWFGFQRMAADRELACDEMALGRAGENEARPYGETVLKLLELCATPAVLPGLMGILEEKSQMTRRILMIARYKQQAGWPIVAMLLLVGLGLVTLTDAQIDKAKSESFAKPDLIGQVHLTNGQPLIASVFIETAGPKVGTSTFCPSCYADCVKHATSDAQGHFKIESLDPTLIFRILVVAKNYAPKYVTKVDPATGPIDVILEPRDNSKSPPENTIHGRVVDAKGAPVVGAAVEAGGIHYKDGGGMWGELKGVDPLAVTDEHGEFLIASLKPFASLDIKVDARGFAPKTFMEVRSGKNQHDLTVTEGAVVSGRVMWNGEPLPGVSVGVVSTDRSAGNFAGNFEVGTGPDGRFSFLNLPPNVQYDLYGIMGTVQKYGAIASTHISTGADGSTADAGDLTVGPAHRIAGRVILDDGAPIPPKTRLMIGRGDAWDSLHIELDKDGRFDEGGIASGVIDLSVRVPGYRLSKKNTSLDLMNPFRLVGQVNKDIAGLTVLLEKGKDLEPDFSNPPMDDGPETRPLSGAEGGGLTPKEILSKNWVVSGHVIDAKTGQAMTNFLVTPGNRNFRQISYDKANAAQATNFVFTVDVNKRFADPLIKIEADGYIPVTKRPPPGNSSNFDVQLQPGSGPSGIVFTQDGKPARNVTVGLLCDGQQGISIGEDGNLQSWRDKNIAKKTDEDGKFSFPPELDMLKVVASSSDGFKLVSVSELSANPKIMLEPWGRVTGTLHRPSGPGTNEDLDLKFSADTLSDPFTLQAGAHAVTDDAGRFEFERVPPGKLDLSYRVKMNENSWHDEQLQSVTVIPGQTLELKINASERQAPGTRSFPSQPQARRTGTDIKGTVFMPDGNPAHFIKVALLVPNQAVTLGKGFIVNSFKAGRDDSLVTTTDATGRFTLPGVEGAMGIIAVHEAGFVRVEMPTNGPAVLKLEPWGEIHGTLKIGRKLGLDQIVDMRDFPFDGLSFEVPRFRTRTDDKGQFVMTYVPPGERGLAREISLGGGSITSGTPIPVMVKAGGITEVTLGGNGREVNATVVYPDAPADFDWKNARVAFHTVRPLDGAKNTDYKMRSYVSEMTTNNGSFVFEDVLPGAYEFSVNVEPQPRRFYNSANYFNFYENLQSFAVKDVVVPGGISGKADEPYDLGVIKLHTVRPLTVGEVPIPIEGRTADGQKVNITDFHGKYFLLSIALNDFGPDLVKQLRPTFESFGKDDRFAMLSFFGWQQAPALKEFARTNNVAWNVASFASPTPELADYFKSATNNPIEQMVLVGPDGKIIAKDLQGDAIKAAVATALTRK